MKFKIFRDKVREYRFNLLADNGEVIATSEGYEDKRDCEHAIKLVKRASEATVEDTTI